MKKRWIELNHLNAREKELLFNLNTEILAKIQGGYGVQKVWANL